jgi:asparagine synthase (glutamine-hydrolysing)
MTSAFAEPFAVQSALGMLRLSRTIRSAGIKVVITGDGGDDAFLGYDRHRLMQTVERVARFVPAAFGPFWRGARRLIPQTGALRRGTHFVDYVSGGLGAYLRAHNGLPVFRAHGLTGERLRDQIPRSRGEPFSPSGRTLLTDYLRHDLRHQFVGEYLTKVDGSTMHYGLEARAPFFDHVLWEHAASLPYEIRLRDGQLKAVLREIARRQISDRVARGQKRGFSIPVERWLAGRWRRDAQTKLRDSILVSEGWVDGRALDRVLRDQRVEGLGAHHLWYLLVLEEWMRDARAAAVEPAVLPRVVS